MTHIIIVIIIVYTLNPDGGWFRTIFSRPESFFFLSTYHCLVEMKFVDRGLVGGRHGGRPVHAVVDLVERVETRAGVSVRDRLAQQFADLCCVCC